MGILSSIIFVGSLVGAIVIGISLLSYICHCFLVTMEGTASGMDDIPWPDEPFLDWLWKPPYLITLMAFWSLIVGGIAFLLVPTFVETWIGLGTILILSVWLFFPISLYSSLGARSLIHFLYGPLLRRLVRRLPELLFVYVLTAPLIAGGLALLFLAITRGGIMIPLADLALPPILLWHARVLGRLGWLLGYRTPLPRKKAQSRQAQQEKKLKRELKKMNLEVVDPWNVPEEEVIEVNVTEVPEEKSETQAPEEEDDREFERTVGKGYEVLSETQTPTWLERREDRSASAGYAIAPESNPSPASETAPSRVELPPEPPLREERPDVSPPPKYVFWSGLWEFPFYNRTLGAWFYLSLWGILELLFLHIMFTVAS